MSDSLMRFEVIAALYYTATGHLAPGKDSRTEDSSSEENYVRFSEWRASQGLQDAVTRIVKLEDELRRISKGIEILDLL